MYAVDGEAVNKYHVQEARYQFMDQKQNDKLICFTKILIYLIVACAAKTSRTRYAIRIRAAVYSLM